MHSCSLDFLISLEDFQLNPMHWTAYFLKRKFYNIKVAVTKFESKYKIGDKKAGRLYYSIGINK